jgi:hypothetical protein
MKVSFAFPTFFKQLMSIQRQSNNIQNHLSMKFIKGLALIITVLVVLSCDNESNDTATVNDLSDYAKNYFKMRNSNGVAQDGFNSSTRMSGPANMSFQGLYNNALSASAGRIAGNSSETPSSDTTIYNDPWTSCAQVTTTNNNDGSITTVYDYGDGCEEGWNNYKYWTKGKYAFTYRNIYSNTRSVFKDSYYYQSSSDNYGGKYYYDSSTWSSNGSSIYEGESEYDTTLHTYKGNYSSNYDYVYTWNTQIYVYKGISKSSYTDKTYIIEQNSAEYNTGSDYYKTAVLAPLVMRYDCQNGMNKVGEVFDYIARTYVSGREFIRYKQDDQEGSFEIDYGNGECDNVITIIEKGKRVEVDLGQQPVYAW